MRTSGQCWLTAFLHLVMGKLNFLCVCSDSLEETLLQYWTHCSPRSPSTYSLNSLLPKFLLLLITSHLASPTIFPSPFSLLLPLYKSCFNSCLKRLSSPMFKCTSVIHTARWTFSRCIFAANTFVLSYW